MEPADEAPDQRRRHGHSCRDIVRQARVIGGGKWNAGLQTPAPRGEAERALGRNMARLRREGADMPTDGTPPREGQADFPIGGAGGRTEQVGRDHGALVTPTPQYGSLRWPWAGDN